MEAKKAALRADDMAKGVFYIAGSVPPQEPQERHVTSPQRYIVPKEIRSKQNSAYLFLT